MSSANSTFAEKRASKKDSVDVQEKAVDEQTSFDQSHGDDALQLVGSQRTTQFSEAYYARLRRKLVSRDSLRAGNTPHHYIQDWWIPPLAASVYFTQVCFLYLQLSNVAC
jgi:ACS family allantoate permease-like MFS transporter